MAGQPKRGCGPVYVWNCVMWLMHLNATWQKLNPSIAGKTLWNKVRVSIKLNCPARFCTQILSDTLSLPFPSAVQVQNLI
jgi:hypothetical protein